jgi:hypothetical protein
VRQIPSDSQDAFRGFSRGRRTRLARTARTTLLKADQWARGDAVAGDVAEALDSALKSLKAKKK